MKLDKFYHLEYSDHCLHLYCYIHVSADASFSLLQVFRILQEAAHMLGYSDLLSRNEYKKKRLHIR